MDLRTSYFNLLKRKGLYKIVHPLYRWELAREGGYTTVLSFPKSGRSWLRFMLCEAQRLATGLPIERFIFDVPDRRRELPKFYFVHGVSPHEDLDAYHYRRIETGGPGGIVFLIRDPIKALASFYQHLKSRKFHGMMIDDDLPFMDFLTSEQIGLPKYIAFLDYYLDLLERKAVPHLMVKYEDMRDQTFHELSRILAFGGLSLSPAEIEQAIDAASFDKMRRIEENRTYQVGWLLPGKQGRHASYKTRGAFLKDRFEAYDSAAKDYALSRMGESNLLKQLGYLA
ncbi:MAG: sulfotransferase domain-containing protein [Alphaproteobacteria bacterium]|nr:sulfotransferase domain-containing protein [Alphaproteobacteria bacterium]